MRSQGGLEPEFQVREQRLDGAARVAGLAVRPSARKRVDREHCKSTFPQDLRGHLVVPPVRACAGHDEAARDVRGGWEPGVGIEPVAGGDL